MIDQSYLLSSSSHTYLLSSSSQTYLIKYFSQTSLLSCSSQNSHLFFFVSSDLQQQWWVGREGERGVLTNYYSCGCGSVEGWGPTAAVVGVEREVTDCCSGGCGCGE